MSLAPGTNAGPYKVVGTVGAGGMGEVYRALDTRLGREVAIKVLPASLRTDSERLRRFEREARATSAINHPNILAVFDVGEHDGAPYLVCELLEGSTLRVRMQEGALPLRKALEYAIQIAQGLAAAHDKQLVHRDLKPENLFVTTDGRVKILDFGLAREVGPEEPTGTPSGTDDTLSHTASGAILGTAGYMSPEQTRGLPADQRSDIFSFGVVLYEMLAHRRPFDGPSAIERAYAILNDDPTDLREIDPEIPEAVSTLVRRCLEKKPAERYRSARDLAFHLQALSSISAITAPRSLVLPRPSRRLRPVAAIAAAGLALVAGGFLLGRVARRPERAASAPAAAPAQYRRLTFRLGRVASARFSPDGSSIVYSAALEGQPMQIFLALPGHPEVRPLAVPGTRLFAISSRAEMALGLDAPGLRTRTGFVLARAPLAGGEPRALLEGVDDADWSPDGAELAVVRRGAGTTRLEYPAGKLVYETTGWMSQVRVSPDGDAVAFIDHPVLGDDRGSVALVTRDGKRTELSGPWGSAWGLAWSADGREVWFTATNLGVVRSLHAVTRAGIGRDVASIPGDMVILDVAASGRVLVRREDVRWRVLGKTPADDRERDLAWLDYSQIEDLTPDGGTLLLVEWGQSVGGDEYVTYLRRTDGSPALRLGDGYGLALSPDARWVVMAPRMPFDELQLVPTGAGDSRPLPRGTITEYLGASFFPDGKRVLLHAREQGRAPRLWVQDVAGGPPRALSAEGTGSPGTGQPISPDGTRVLATDDNGGVWALPADGGAPVAVAGIADDETPVQWTADGKGLYVLQMGSRWPRPVALLDLATRARRPWRDLAPTERAGARPEALKVFVTPDGATYAFAYERALSDLYLADGLR